MYFRCYEYSVNRLPPYEDLTFSSNFTVVGQESRIYEVQSEADMASDTC